jgi:hypothetical protein
VPLLEHADFAPWRYPLFAAPAGWLAALALLVDTPRGSERQHWDAPASPGTPSAPADATRLLVRAGKLASLLGFATVSWSAGALLASLPLGLLLATPLLPRLDASWSGSRATLFCARAATRWRAAAAALAPCLALFGAGGALATLVAAALAGFWLTLALRSLGRAWSGREAPVLDPALSPFL